MSQPPEQPRDPKHPSRPRRPPPPPQNVPIPPELRSQFVSRWFHDTWPAASAAVGVIFILVDFFSTGTAHLNGLAGIGMAFCGVLPIVHYDRARKG